MKNSTIDNSIDTSPVILWQYDHAMNLIALLSGMDGLTKTAVTDFYDSYADGIFSIDNADEFGLAFWGINIGIPWVRVTVDGEERKLSKETYRKLLKAFIYIYNSNDSSYSISRFLEIAFGGKVLAIDVGDMSLTYTPYYYETTSGETTEKTPLVKKSDGKYYTVTRTTVVQNKEDGSHEITETYSDNTEYTGAANVKSATDEVVALISNTEFVESYFPHPAGVLVRGSRRTLEGIIGLNDNQSTGQNLRNFSLVPALYSDESVNGGIFVPGV